MEKPRKVEPENVDSGVLEAVLFILVCCVVIIGTWELSKWAIHEFNQTYELTFILEKNPPLREYKK